MSESKYHPSPAAREAKLEEIAKFLAEVMYQLTTDFKGYEKEIGQLLTNQLGAYISICTKNPGEALVEAANHLGNTDFGAFRAAHFGYSTLGATGTQRVARQRGAEILTPDDNVHHIGDPRNRSKE
jgi:hypothetical protein